MEEERRKGILVEEQEEEKQKAVKGGVRKTQRAGDVKNVKKEHEREGMRKRRRNRGKALMM